jgi:hypothetical protein
MRGCRSNSGAAVKICNEDIDRALLFLHCYSCNKNQLMKSKRFQDC